MFYHYLKIAFRTLVRFKSYATINLAGLALGLTTGILILVYVSDELAYDTFHQDADRIYRVGTDMTDIKTGGSNGGIETNGWAVGALLKKEYPEVDEVVYITNGSNFHINHDGKRFEERIFFAGQEFFDLFSFELVQGSAASALAKPYGIVITESLQAKYFPGQQALGKTLLMADTLLMEVTGVMKDVPGQSHMQFGMLISFATYEALNASWFTYDGGWGNLNVRNYIRLKEGVDTEHFFSKAKMLYMDRVKEEMEKWGMYMYLGFERLDKIYLHTERGNGMGPLGSMERLYMVSGIAVFVILLACINFINLATARSVYRAREVGLRKVVGSTRGALIRQFLSESFMLTVLACVLAIALIGVLLPFFNQLLGKHYTMSVLTQPVTLMESVMLVLIISLLAGYYPAIVMSALRPYEVLKGNLKSGARGVQLRRVLVVFQFMIAALLITSTLVVVDQLNYMQNKDLGFSANQVIVLDMGRVGNSSATSTAESKPMDAFENELRSLSITESVTFTNAVPSRTGWVGQWAYPADRPNEGSIGMEYMTIDEHYLQTLGLTLIAGRNFNQERVADLDEGLIINETAVQQLGWGTPENAIGKKIDSPSKHPAGTVIGVVRDYHQFGLQQLIYPMAMDYKPEFSRYFALRFKPTNTSQLIDELQRLWKKHFDGYDFSYFFLDENFARAYQAEQRLARVFTLFSGVTIIIAIIGLLGLVSFMVVSRTKEIGVRKIMGANTLSIARLLSKEFLLLVLVANVVACPLAYYAASAWLEKFAYRTSINFGLFLFTLIAAIGITVITISFQTVKAALANPVDSLRYE